MNEPLESAVSAPLASGASEPAFPDGPLDLNEVAIALCDALELVGVDDVRHGKRVAFIAYETAWMAALDPEVRSDVFLAALLHDCGVSSTRIRHLITGRFEWEGWPEHCRAGYELLRGFAPFERLAQVVLHHHTHWNDPLLQDLPPNIALLSNVIFLADRVDVLQKHARGEILMARHGICKAVEELAGVWFAPALVESFGTASEPQAFWLGLEERHLDRWVEELARAERPLPATPETLRDLAALFAKIVDAKSPFTASHSQGVARVARFLGVQCGLPIPILDQLEIAGLLHDLGKLRVPDDILEKPGGLNETEFAQLERHSFETYQILRRVGPFQTLAAWAASHHEAISGRGYPFHQHGDEIGLPARIIAVADVFQALAQRRPYRAPLAPAAIPPQMLEMADAGRLDAELVHVVSGHLDECWHAAVGS